MQVSRKKSKKTNEEKDETLTSVANLSTSHFPLQSTMPVPIKIKHAGKSYDLEVDTSAPATVFKEQIYHLTGVPIDKVKVVVKGGMLKVRTSFPVPLLRAQANFPSSCSIRTMQI